MIISLRNNQRNSLSEVERKNVSSSPVIELETEKEKTQTINTAPSKTDRSSAWFFLNLQTLIGSRFPSVCQVSCHSDHIPAPRPFVWVF